MRANTSPHIQVKAAGGVRTLDALLDVMALGVTRIGATATETIIEDFRPARPARAAASPAAPVGRAIDGRDRAWPADDASPRPARPRGWIRPRRCSAARSPTRRRTRIETASHWCADAIASDGLVHLFGAGHSRIPVEEMFPRYGSYPGFNPIVELSVTFHTQVVGANGQRQAMFIERMPGLAEVILSNFRSVRTT